VVAAARAVAVDWPAMEDKELLRDIKALLEEQNRLLADLKRHMTHSHVRFWIVLAGVLLLLLFPNITAT
jgi:hypothetical protein